MAIMIPGVQNREDFNASGGELLLYEKLQELPDTYYVLHSTHWNEKRRKSEMSYRSYIEWGEADFTVFHPTYGIIVFEVKDGLISYTRDSGWIQKNRNSGVEKSIDPLQQAEKSKYYFLEIIKQHFNGTSPYSLCSAVWFTAGDRKKIEGDMPLAYKNEIVLWANDMESATTIEQAIRRIYNYYDARTVTPNEELTRSILDILAPEFGAFQSVRSRAMATKALFFRMTQEQAYLLDYLEEQDEAAIHGVAGTGKTVLAVQKAKRLAENEKVLFLCFNRFLKEHLAAAYGNPNIEFNNLDALFSGKVRRPLPTTPKEKDEAIFDFLVDWEDFDWPYKHIVIDEGQDFKDEHLQALHEIAKAKKGCFYVFYDRNQFVQGVAFPEWLTNMDCRLVLSRNCRNTKEIALTSTRPIGLEKDKIKMRRDSSMDSYAEPPKPNIFFIKDKNELKEDLIKLFKKYTSAGIPKANIVVLSCKSNGESILDVSDFTLTSTYRLVTTKNNSDILFTTVRKFKGLEADVVICIDIDENTFGSEKERNAFYVGTSRATTYLDLFTGTTSNCLATALTGIEMSGPRSMNAISVGLCVKIGVPSDLTSI
jgi:hypothetical protein